MISPEAFSGGNTEDFQTPEEKPVESGEDLSDNYPALLVLGGGFIQTADNKQNDTPKLSLESRMRTLAAGEMFKSGLIDKIIFSGGKTGGNNNPSEAEAMRSFLLSKYPQIKEQNIILEENALETSENMRNIKEILDKNGLDEAVVLTSEAHLARAIILAKKNEINVVSDATAEEEIISRSPRHYQKFVEKYSASTGHKISQIREFLLRSLLVVDRRGRIPQFLAHQIRQN